jgi:putative membrane protein
MAEWLPWVNTALIVVSGAFLVLGYGFIRARRITAHHRSMLTATVFAGLFLIVYVTRFILFGSKGFPGSGAAYTVYLGILVPHIVLAVAVGPLALITILRAFGGQLAKHRRIARITLPIWAFVAASGWVIYLMLYVIAWA